MALTTKEIEAIEPSDAPQKKADGKGLYILVQPKGGKLWQIAYRFPGINKHGEPAMLQKVYSVGPFPAVSLADARLKRAEIREMLDKGIDPMAAKGEAKADAKAAAMATAAPVKTFGDSCDEFLAMEEAGGKKKPKTLNGKRNMIAYLKDAFGAKDPKDITRAEVLQFLRDFDKRRLLDTRDRCRRLGEQIMSIALMNEEGESNVFREFPSAMLLEKTSEPRPAVVEPTDVAVLMKALWIDRLEKQTTELITYALRLLALTAVRPGELAGMEWNEIDFESGNWSIPGARMKMGKKHIVPLSRQAIEILRKVQAITGGGRFVFSTRLGTRIPTHSLSKRLRFLGFDTGRDHCPHGFRSTFSTTMNAETDKDENKAWPSDIIELSLAHIEGGVKGLYDRAGPTVHIGARRKLMQRWADRIDMFAGSADPIPFKRPEVA
jgi:integrase